MKTVVGHLADLLAGGGDRILTNNPEHPSAEGHRPTDYLPRRPVNRTRSVAHKDPQHQASRRSEGPPSTTTAPPFCVSKVRSGRAECRKHRPPTTDDQPSGAFLKMRRHPTSRDPPASTTRRPRKPDTTSPFRVGDSPHTRHLRQRRHYKRGGPGTAPKSVGWELSAAAESETGPRHDSW